MLLAFGLSVPAFAADDAPSDASLRQLLEVTESRKLFDSNMQQIDAMMESAIQKELAGRQLDAARQRAVDEFRSKAVALIQQDMSWETFEPSVLDIYRKSFTQEEIDGMLAFYRSEAGQAVIRKLPLVMQGSMQMVQERLAVVLPKLQALQRDLVASMQEQPAK
ncbi:DUF2059 domain-containing protein [Pseudoxanthomonas sangjuensis]|uniref:DUF2059 domain-containing protein n=1 Tax=Pseudoxanthomonas sangjuensis TaxID=1503750 RepID=UPI001390D33D|nr:DUF2059 domain-containing protein [Pseudoxanthomonas sangjuensis]